MISFFGADEVRDAEISYKLVNVPAFSSFGGVSRHRTPNRRCHHQIQSVIDQ